MKFDNLSEVKTSFCVPLGYNYSEIEPYVKKGNLIKDSGPNLESCFKKLLVGRVKSVITDGIIGRKLLKKIKLNSSQVKIIPNILFGQDLHFLMSQNHPRKDKFIKNFNLGLEKLMKNGRYNKILGLPGQK